MNHNEDQAISDFRRALASVYMLRYGLAVLTVWAFVYGTAVLALRGAAGLSRLDLLWGLLSLPIVIVPSIILALRRLPSRDRVRAVLDHHGRCGGLLMAGADHNLGAWQSTVPEVHRPRLAWHGGRSWGLFAAALAFVALGFLVPQSIASLGGSRLDVSRDVERLKEQLEALAKEKALEAERTEALKLTLDDLKRDASGKDPVKTIEALDHVQDQVKKAADKAAEKAQRNLEDIGRAEALNDALKKNGDKLTAEQLKEALTKMADIIKKAADENELLQENLDAETLEALKKNKLTPEMLKKIADALKQGKKGMEMRIAKLVRAKLISPEEMKKGENASKVDGAELAAYLKENGVSKDAADKLGEEGGKGGTDEGPGSSKLTFGDESTEDGVKYKEQELSMAEQQNLKDSTKSGVSQGSPNIGKEKALKGGSGALDAAATGGGSAATQVVLPRHKGAVMRYFERPERKK